ncbi:unnamed protein product [Cochlearia groenlandica]
MTITSSSSSFSEKSEKKNKSLLVSTIVNDEFASSSKNKIFGQEQESIATKLETLKKNHENLKIGYENLQKRVKHEEETYDAMRKHQKTKIEELMATNIGLFVDIERAKSDKDKYKKIFEEMKLMVSDRLAEIDKLNKKKEELLTVKCKGLEQADIIGKSCVEIVERFDVVEADCRLVKSLNDAKVAASGNVMSKIVETYTTNEDHNVSKNVTDDVVMISDKIDPEYKRTLEQCRKRRHSSKVTYSLISSPSSSILNIGWK